MLRLCEDRKSTRLNSSHSQISYAVFCLNKKCCVNMALALKGSTREVIMVNCNPETVSTDFDVLDKLYFEELTLERVLDIIDKEKPAGVVVSVGGQTANNLTLGLAKHARILGTSATS